MGNPDRVREPAVAGKFYPSAPGKLREQIEAFIDKDAVKQDAIACLLPHAGYIYSGPVAGKTVSRITVKDHIILLGPNHTGYGARYSVMPEGSWQTPLGEIRIDSGLAQAILGSSKYLESDVEAHLYEHSLEVEIPFLQYFKTDFSIVPVTFLSDDFYALKEIGAEIAGAIMQRSIKDSTLIVASSDMTHYEPQKTAQKKDEAAIQAILELDENKLADRIRSLNISMCGYAPAIAMISAAKSLGAKRAELVKYQTSGDVTGDKSSVVGYAGIIIY